VLRSPDGTTLEVAEATPRMVRSVRVVPPVAPSADDGEG
jgi:hypothetical protein